MRKYLLAGVMAAVATSAFAQSPVQDDLKFRTPIAPGAIVGRSVKSKLADQLSVGDFGAACDGVTDDSAAILNAVGTGKQILVPSGATCLARSVPTLSPSLFGGGNIVLANGATVPTPTLAAIIASSGLAATAVQPSVLASALASIQFPVTSVNGQTGAISVPPYVLPQATPTNLGGVTVSTGLQSSAGALSVIYGTTFGTAAQGNDPRIVGALQTTGGNMTGPLLLSANPALPLGAATKAYVDAATSAAVPSLTGAAPITVTGSTIGVLVGTTANTLAAGNDSRFTLAGTALQPFGNGTGYLINASGQEVSVGSGLQLQAGTLTAPAAMLYSLPQATATTLGGVTISTGLAVANGAASVVYGTASNTAAQGNDARFALASTALQPVSGGAGALLNGTGQPITIGTGLALQGTTLNATAVSSGTSSYTLPNATTTTLGGVEISTGLSVSNGIVSTNFGTSAGTVAQGNDSRIVGAMQAGNNLSDLASIATARTNLGLGSAAQQAATAFDAAGAATTAVASGRASALPTATTSQVYGGSGTSGTAAVLTPAQIAAFLPVFSSSAAGLVPTSPGGTVAFLRADGTFATPAATTYSGTAPIVVSGSSISATVGTAANTLAAGNDSRLVGALQSANNLSDVASTSTARTNLGLGTAATQAIGAFDASGAAVAATASAAQKANNLSDLTSASTARTNLGLGTAALSASTAFDASGAATTARTASLPSASTSQVYAGTGTAGTAAALTSTQLTALVNTFTSSLAGAVPASGGGSATFLRADGTWATPPMGSSGSGGTVTSVGLSLPSIFTVANSPVTSTGTLAGTLNSQTANTVLAAPNGSNGVPTFRALTTADIPPGTAVQTKQRVSANGTSITVTAGTTWLAMVQNVQNASQTIVLPSSPNDGQLLNISTVGDISALTLSPASGAWASGTELPANSGFTIGYDAGSTSWLRMH